MTFLFIIAAQILVAVFFGYRWIHNDASGEAWFSIVSAISIPLTLEARKRFTGKPIEQVPDCTLTVSEQKIRCFDLYVYYGFQLCLDIRANTRITIKSLKIRVPDVYKWGNKGAFREVIDFKIIKQNDVDFMSGDKADFGRKLSSASSIEVHGQVVEAENRYLKIVGHMLGERLPDGWEGLPSECWSIELIYDGHKVVEVPFDFSIHAKSISEPSAYRYTGFSSLNRK